MMSFGTPLNTFWHKVFENDKVSKKRGSINNACALSSSKSSLKAELLELIDLALLDDEYLKCSLWNSDFEVLTSGGLSIFFVGDPVDLGCDKSEDLAEFNSEPCLPAWFFLGDPKKSLSPNPL